MNKHDKHRVASAMCAIIFGALAGVIWFHAFHYGQNKVDTGDRRPPLYYIPELP